MYSVDGRELAKRDIARALLSNHQGDGTGVISVQVLQEFYNALTKKLKSPQVNARTLAETISRDLRVCPLTEAQVFQAMGLAEEAHLSYWDAAILVSAEVARCPIVYSEDMQNGFKWHGLEVQNPF